MQLQLAAELETLEERRAQDQLSKLLLSEAERDKACVDVARTYKEDELRR